MTTPTRPGDQASQPIFRLLLLVQVLAAGFFGLFPLIAPDVFARLFGYGGSEPLIYRLAGASAFGYSVAAAYALWRNSSWAELRIPIVATLTFNVAAVAGSIAALVDGGPVILPAIVLVAAGTFAVLALYWLRRDEGPAPPSAERLSSTAVAILGLATLSAAVFGALPLAVPQLFAQVFGLNAADAYIYMLAGAATLGYATAGVLEIREASFSAIRVQNLAALLFNAAGAIASANAVLNGQGGLLAPLIVLAAGFFTVTLFLIQTKRLR